MIYTTNAIESLNARVPLVALVLPVSPFAAANMRKSLN